MAIKRKNQKKQQLELLEENAVRIRCCYCDLKGTCSVRSRKEQYEKTGMNTLCIMTPNRPKSFVKKRK